MVWKIHCHHCLSSSSTAIINYHHQYHPSIETISIHQLIHYTSIETFIQLVKKYMSRILYTVHQHIRIYVMCTSTIRKYLMSSKIFHIMGTRKHNKHLWYCQQFLCHKLCTCTYFKWGKKNYKSIFGKLWFLQ